MRKRHAQHEEHVNHERWLVSYADMITLLFALFLVLYAMSKINEAKFQQLSTSLSHAMKNEVPDAVIPSELAPKADPSASPSPPDPKPDPAAARKKEDAILHTITKELRAALKAKGFREAVHVDVEESGLVMTLVADGLLFDSGGADVKPQGAEVLTTLGKVLEPYGNLLRVEGHTDNVPIQGGRFENNWELSAVRATNVALVLVKRSGINPERMSVMGLGEWHPLCPNSSDTNRRRNRRVELVILRGELRPTGAPMLQAPTGSSATGANRLASKSDPGRQSTK